MENREMLKRFENAHGIFINKMFWLAGSLDSRELKDMAEDDMSIKDWQRAFPEMDSAHIDYYVEHGDAIQLLCDYRKFGFLAQVYFPHHYGFNYKKDGSVSGCMVSGGMHTINYAYGETINELMTKIETIAEISYKEDMENDKKKKKKAARI